MAVVRATSRGHGIPADTSPARLRAVARRSAGQGDGSQLVDDTSPEGTLPSAIPRTTPMRPWLTLLLAVACNPDGGTGGGDCADLCDVLVDECGYAAYPSNESCEQGCAYSASEGADIAAQKSCVESAECNTFEIVECEHAHGN